MLPTTLPMAMSALPFRAEDMLTVSSGAEVPKATMVSPMTMDGIWKRFGNGCGTVCQAIGTQKNEEQSSDKKQYIHRYVNFEYKDNANRIQNFHVCMKKLC